jgi:hypothetical protein
MTSSTLVVVAVLVTACGDRTDAPVETPETAVAADGALTAFDVDGEGLRFFVVATGSSRPLPFGTDSAVVHDAVLRTAAGGPAESGSGGDCPGSYSRWANGLTLRYTDGRFVGWSVRGGDGTVTTASGVGIGSSRVQVEDALAIRVSSSSLGSEFTAGELAGLFDGPSPDAKVTHLWAGETCIAR